VNADTIKKVAGAFVAVVAAAGVLFWGVPYWMQTQVRAQVTAELREQAVSTAVDDVEAIAKANKATLTAIQGTLTRMEQAQIRRDQLFAEYLERQAARANQ
jgi:hypothetical protein